MPDFLLKKDTEPVRIQVERGGSIFLYISFGIFALILLGYGGLIFLNQSQNNNLNEFIKQIEIKEQNLRPEVIQQIFLLEQRLNNTKTLLSQHNLPLNVYKTLEKNTHPQVRFSNFNADIPINKITMTGETTSYATLAHQIGILERNSLISNVEFGGLSISPRDLLSFNLILTFKSNFFKALQP